MSGGPTWKVKNILDPSTAWDYGASLIGGSISTLPTGLRSWDGACSETNGEGLADWWMVILGGASNSGKTQLLLHLLRKASECGMVPGLITMEVPIGGIQRSIYSRITTMGYHDLHPRNFVGEDVTERLDQLKYEVAEYSSYGRSMVVAEHDGSPTLPEILDMCRAMKAAGCRVIGLDHLQLIKAPPSEIADRATEIAEELRRFAHRERVLVLALSQLNRVGAKERGRRPICQDLWGGTSMEANANQVILIDHSHVKRDMERPHIVRTKLILDKNREGPNRVVMNVEANYVTGMWREAMPDEEHLWELD